MQGRVQQRGVPAKLVEYKTGHPRPFRPRQQRHGARQGREGPAPVNVGHKGHMGTGITGHAHVHDIVRLEVDLGRAARPFQHHHVGFGRQTAVGAPHGLPGFGLVPQIGPHTHLPHRLPQHDNLRACIGCGLQKNGIHAHIGGQTAGGGLKRLGASHLLAVGGHKRIERHVLRLEGHDPEASARQQAAQGRCEQTFARVGAGSLKHDRRRQPRRAFKRTDGRRP